MGSLSAHLRRPDDHGRLAFHPDCPVCRDERLLGAVPAKAVVSRRTQALLAAGVLALSTTPTAVLAAEPDQEHEGMVAPDQVAPGDPGSAPDFDPGGASTDLPFDTARAPDAPASPNPDEDTGALEPEPAANVDAPVADAGDRPATPSPQARPPTPAPPAATTPRPAHPPRPRPPRPAPPPPPPPRRNTPAPRPPAAGPPPGRPPARAAAAHPRRIGHGARCAASCPHAGDDADEDDATETRVHATDHV